MAYNNGFPIGYQPYYQPYQYPVQQNIQMPQAQQIPQVQPQNNGFVRVQSENEARMYPVAPGNSIIFIDENAPYCYTKTVDTSQLDRPKFDKYRLVKEEEGQQIETKKPSVEYATKADLQEMQAQIEQLKALIPTEEKPTTSRARKES